MLTITPRRKRWLKLTSARWQRRVLFVAGGLVVGAAAVALAELADLAQLAFNWLLSKSRYASLVVTPAGFALSVYLTQRYFPNAQGRGIPQAIAARHLTDTSAQPAGVDPHRHRQGAFDLARTALWRLGRPRGSDGAGRRLHHVRAGPAVAAPPARPDPGWRAAAGVAAAFNMPLAGIVFGIEEMSRACETRTSSLVIATVIAAGLTSLALMGNYAYFGTTPLALGKGIDLASHLRGGALPRPRQGLRRQS